MKLEVTAKNVSAAIEKGLKELGKTQEEVDIKIIEEGGFFKKAKIELIYEGEDIKAEKPIVEKEITEKPKKEKKVKESKKEKCECVEDNKEKCTCGDDCTCGPECSCHNQEDYEKIVLEGRNFLEGLFSELGQHNEIDSVVTKEGVCFSVNGETVNDLIGYRGETLNALQYVLSIIVRNKCNTNVKIFLDVENYKVRRETTLINLAERLAHKAAKIGKPVKLEPMNAYERRIIHTALQNDKFVTTKSEGEEPNRYLVIIPNRQEKE